MKRIIRSLTGMSLVLVVSLTASALSGIAWTGNLAGFQQEFAKNDEAPLFSEFKGVHIGLTADEARSKLGAPSDKGDEQDVFTLSEQNTAQVYYDKDKKVYAVSVFYIDAKAAPAP